jgi:hypothetical protein
MKPGDDLAVVELPLFTLVPGPANEPDSGQRTTRQPNHSPRAALHLLAPLPLPAYEVAVLRPKLARIDPAALDSAVAAGTLGVLPGPIK